MRDEEPWVKPAGGCADGGGVTGHRRWQTIGNNGTQSQGLSGKPYARPVAWQTTGNRGTAKPEAKGRAGPLAPCTG